MNIDGSRVLGSSLGGPQVAPNMPKDPCHVGGTTRALKPFFTLVGWILLRSGHLVDIRESLAVDRHAREHSIV